MRPTQGLDHRLEAMLKGAEPKLFSLLRMEPTKAVDRFAEQTRLFGRRLDVLNGKEPRGSE